MPPSPVPSVRYNPFGEGFLHPLPSKEEQTRSDTVTAHPDLPIGHSKSDYGGKSTPLILKPDKRMVSSKPESTEDGASPVLLKAPAEGYHCIRVLLDILP